MKKITYLLTSIIAAFLFTTNVYAASGSISASASSKTVVVGSTFTVTVKVSCSEALGSWQFGIAYDSAYISLQSGDTSIAAYGDGSSSSKTYTYKFKAIKSGNAGVRVTGAQMVSWNDVNTLFTPSVSNTSVTVKTQAEIEASYSKDNNLKSLSVTGFELSPAFNKDTTEYSIEVPDDVTSITVNASVNDSRASVRGTGTIDVSEGSNKVEVVVTAQNGGIKTYVINVTVKDLTPINVTVDNVEYTIVKKESLLTNPTGYTPTTIKINEIDVPAFTSDLTKFTIVGLKDAEGNVGLFIYKNGSYTHYNEIKSATLTLYPATVDEIPNGFTETTIKINDIEIPAYQSNSSKGTILAYAMNVETGKEAFYLYDKEENSFVKYDSTMYDALYEENNEFKLYLCALGTVTGILLLISLIIASKNRRLKKIIYKVSENRVEKPKEEIKEVPKIEEPEENILEEKPKKNKKKKKETHE